MNELRLFTERFPYSGSESFLETEIVYLAIKFDKIIIYPANTGDTFCMELPPNVTIELVEANTQMPLKSIMWKHGWLIAFYFISEFIQSPKRWIYIKEFKWNLYRLIGLIQSAVGMREVVATVPGVKSVFYSYWFNDWVSKLIFAKYLWKAKGIAIFTRVHLYDFEEEFHDKKYIPFRYTEMKKISKVVPISDYASNYLQDKYNTNNIESTSRLGVDKGDLNEGGKTEKYVIVSCSSLTWYKRPVLLAETFKQIGLPIVWYHFGSGKMEQEFLDGTKNLPTTVSFHYMGHVSNKSILQFYRENDVDLLLNVSAYEGIPVSMMEAISFGIPIAACNICGIPELVSEKSGILFEKNLNAESIGKVVHDYLIKQARSVELRNSVLNVWDTKFNAEKNYPGFIDKYLLN